MRCARRSTKCDRRWMRTAGWIDITVAGLVVRLRNLVDIMQDCQLLREAIAEDRNPDSLKLAFMPDTLAFAVPHRDHGLALLSAASVVLSILACCGFSIATGWPDGVIAPLFAAVVGSILAGVDDPLPTFRSFYGIFLIVIAIHGIYLFGVLPRITTLEMLIAALAPAFLLFGWMSARPATARRRLHACRLYLGSTGADRDILGRFLVLCQLQRRADAGRLAYGRHLRHRSPARSQLDRRPIASQQLDDARRGRRTQVGPGSPRACQSHAASPRPPCRADHRGSRRGKERRRQSSPASNGSECSRCQAGEPWPVTPYQSSNRSVPCSSCLALPGLIPPGRFPMDWWDSSTARSHSRCRTRRLEARDEVLMGLAGIRSGLFPESPAYQPLEIEHRTIAA